MSSMDDLLEFLRSPDSNVTADDFATSQKSPESRNRRIVGSELVPIYKIEVGYSPLSEEDGVNNFYVRLNEGLGRFVDLEAIATDLARMLERRFGARDEFAPSAEQDFDEKGEYVGIMRSFVIDQSTYDFRIKVREHEVIVDVMSGRKGYADKLPFSPEKLNALKEEIGLLSQGYSRKYLHQSDLSHPSEPHALPRLELDNLRFDTKKVEGADGRLCLSADLYHRREVNGLYDGKQVASFVEEPVASFLLELQETEAEQVRQVEDPATLNFIAKGILRKNYELSGR